MLSWATAKEVLERASQEFVTKDFHALESLTREQGDSHCPLTKEFKANGETLYLNVTAWPLGRGQCHF